MAFQRRMIARNAVENAKLSRVSEIFDKRKSSLEKELLDIQATRRLFEASKKTANVTKQRSRTKSLGEAHQLTSSSQTFEEKLPNLSNNNKMSRRISLPSSHKFGTSRNDDNNSKFVQTLEGLEEIQERNHSVKKDFLKLPEIKSKSDSDLSDAKNTSSNFKMKSMESLRTKSPVPKSPVSTESPVANSPVANSPVVKSPVVKSPVVKSPTVIKKQRRHSADVNNNLLPTPEIVCYDVDGAESNLKSIQKQRRESALVELERLSMSADELDQVMAGKFKRIGKGSLAESYLRSKRVQSYESGIDTKEGGRYSPNDVTPARQLSPMGNKLGIPLSISREETVSLRSKSCTELDRID